MAAHLVVWRPTGEPGVHTFIGKVTRQMNQKGYIEIVITDPSEQIQVQPGDFVGVAYDPRSYGGVIPWATLGYADHERDDCVTVAVFGQDLDVPGKIFSLGESYVDRILMLQAVVEISSDGVAQNYPVSYVPTPEPASIYNYGDMSQAVSKATHSSSSSSNDIACSTGIEIMAEPISRIPGNFLNVCPTMRIACDGVVAKWEFFSALEDGTPAYLAVFRHADSGSTFYLVGMTRVVATHFGPATYEVPVNERFHVKVGDVLGVVYDSSTSIGVVPFVDERVLDGYKVEDLQICLKKRIFVEDVRSATSALNLGDNQTKRLILVRAHVQSEDKAPVSYPKQTYSSSQFRPPYQRSRQSQTPARHHPVSAPRAAPPHAAAMSPFHSSVSATPANCQVGPNLFDRAPARRPGVWLNVCPDVMAPCSGRIHKWQFMSSADDMTATYLSVWRQEGGDRRKYRLIGFNRVYADRTGLISYNVPDDEKLDVKQGDLIGVMYDLSARRGGAVGFADSDEPEGYTKEDFTKCYRARISKEDAEANPVQDFGQPMQTRLVLMSALIESAPGDACPPPPVVQNARVLKIVDQTIKYACQAGYTMEDGIAEVNCINGHWSKTPKCVKDSCGDLPGVEHGRIGAGSSEIGAERLVHCDHGYHIEDENQARIRCLDGGAWSLPGYCVALPTTTVAAASETQEPSLANRCSEPPEIIGGHLIGGSTGSQYGDTRQYKCDTGHVMTGNSVIVCLDSGFWTRPPICNPMQPNGMQAFNFLYLIF